MPPAVLPLPLQILWSWQFPCAAVYCSIFPAAHNISLLPAPGLQIQALYPRHASLAERHHPRLLSHSQYWSAYGHRKKPSAHFADASAYAHGCSGQKLYNPHTGPDKHCLTVFSLSYFFLPCLQKEGRYRSHRPSHSVPARILSDTPVSSSPEYRAVHTCHCKDQYRSDCYRRFHLKHTYRSSIRFGSNHF